ncbi:MAG: hypothetical protein V1660_01750 [archaeon]
MEKLLRIYNMKKGYLFIALGMIALLSLSVAFAAPLEPIREQLLKYGPSLYITNVHTHPAELQPGSEGLISLELENVAPHQLRDVEIELSLPSQFAPADVSRKKIRTMQGLEKTEMNFSIVSLPNAKDGIYTLSIASDYFDEIGTPHSENNTVSLKISSVPSIYTELVSTDLYEGNLLGRVSIKIANTGVGDVKFLVVELLPSQDGEYSIIGSNKDYIGQVNSDDYETVDFKINLNSLSKEIPLSLRLDYSDSNNKAYSKEIILPLKIISAKDAGIKQGNNNLIIIVIVGILIVFVIYRQLRKRKKK